MLFLRSREFILEGFWSSFCIFWIQNVVRVDFGMFENVSNKKKEKRPCGPRKPCRGLGGQPLIILQFQDPGIMKGSGALQSCRKGTVADIETYIQHIQKQNIYTYTQIHTYIHICIYIYIRHRALAARLECSNALHDPRVLELNNS